MTIITVEPDTGDPSAGLVVNVLCDNSGRVGALSYQVPPEMSVQPGDAVTVPFGSRQLHGMVLGPGDPTLATRAILEVHGKRASESELKLARMIADLHFSDLPVVASRLSPRSGRGAQALDAGALLLAEPPRALPDIPSSQNRRLYVRAPLIGAPEIAAAEALRLSANGQVLLICPSVDMLEKTMRFFKSGAARLDSKAPLGAWKGFSEGSVHVGVGTRAAALYSAKNLSGIIVLDEDHPGHFEATQPYTNARDVAAMRASEVGCALTLISANPTTSAMGAKVKIFQIGSRSDWPSVRVIDRNEFAPSDRLLPPPVRAAVNRAFDASKPVFVLAESRKATRRCAKCAEPRPCGKCDSSLCRHQESEPCPRCSNVDVCVLGWDVERVQALFGPKAKALTIAELAEVSGVPALVIMFDLDPALKTPNFNPDALGSHLIVSAARAAGGEGTLMVLTREPDHQLVVNLVIRRDQMAVAKKAWSLAKASELPPFGRLVTIRIGRPKAPNVRGLPGRVHGPRRTADGWEVLVRCKDSDLGKLGTYIERIRRGGKVRVTLL